MGFPTLGKSEIQKSLDELGVIEGDRIYVGAFMAILGNAPALLDDTIDGLLAAVGPAGTVMMPAFNWDYCSGSVFDVEATPSKVGVLSEAFRKRPGVLRSTSPPWSTFCAAGKDAEQIAAIHSASPFGSDSIAQFMVDTDVKYVLIGCDFNSAVFHIHWLEEKFAVPYRYWKEFSGQVRVGGRVEEDISRMYARYLDTEVEVLIDSSRLTSSFQETGLVGTTRLGIGELCAFSTKDYTDFLTPFFERDPLVVLAPEARPQFD